LVRAHELLEQVLGLGQVQADDLDAVPGEDTLAVFLKILVFPGDDPVDSQVNGCACTPSAGHQGGVSVHAPEVVHNPAVVVQGVDPGVLCNRSVLVLRFRPVATSLPSVSTIGASTGIPSSAAPFWASLLA
jgi:hypothetical protein